MELIIGMIIGSGGTLAVIGYRQVRRRFFRR
jgi:hypothetical protein